MEKFDVVVIGGGPAGYVAAIRAAQLGLKAACIESRGALGGTCLNVGCIPSKALLESSELYHKMTQDASAHGFDVKGVHQNIKKMLERKNNIVTKFTQGIEGLFKKNKITYFVGKGSFKDAHTITISGGKKKQEIQGEHIILATGSEPTPLPFAPFDGKTIVSSTEALEFTQVPKKLVVIGAGVIGLELGSVWARLGAKVVVVEALDSILPGWDKAIQRTMKKSLEGLGMEFHVSAKVKKIEAKNNKATVTATDKDQKTLELEADKVLVAIGRRPFTAGLNLEQIDLALDERGRIPTDGDFRTSVSHVFAIGDVREGVMLAHKAEEEGVAVAEILAGQHGHVNYNAIPNVIYTWPEVASVGKHEHELEKGTYKVGQFPFMANGRAMAAGHQEGFIKVLADSKTDLVLGVHMVGPHVSELIAEAALAVEFGASSEDIARTCHAHPTLAETMKEAALGVNKRALHI